MLFKEGQFQNIAFKIPILAFLFFNFRKCRILSQYDVNITFLSSTLSLFLFSPFSLHLSSYFVTSIAGEMIALKLIADSESPRKFHFPGRLFGDHQGYLVNPPFASEKLRSSPATSPERRRRWWIRPPATHFSRGLAATIAVSPAEPLSELLRYAS